LDAEARELHATVCGLVIETMATSRASSLPTSSIFKLVMNSQPYLKTQRSEQDWLRIFERVLRDGSADRGSGVFGKVESSGKDASDRSLEAQWFYVPERDQDQERAALIRSMMPRPGKRTETMKYKQYYWRPLEKISKWDPEDALFFYSGVGPIVGFASRALFYFLRFRSEPLLFDNQYQYIFLKPNFFPLK
jgi:hypothetical protein